MQISKLRIKNYRCIKDTGELSPTKLFALIGKNNAGKSTIVRAIQMFWGHGDTKILESDFHKDTSEDISIEIELSKYYDEQYAKYADDKGVINIEFKVSKNLKSQYMLKGEDCTAKKLKEILPELLVIPALRNPLNESTGGTNSFMKSLISFILKEQSKAEMSSEEGSKNIEDKLLSEATEEEIEIFLKEKRKKQIEKLSEKVNDNFQSILSDESLNVEISPECSLSKVYSSYNTFIKNSDLEKYITEGINLMSCGTGLQSMFILSLLQTYSDMNKCSDSILLIEEPEVYLHPEYQRKMFHALRGIAADNQVIYTTHSPIMIGELWAKDSVRLITLDKGQADVVEIDVELVISELGIKYEDVLNPRVVIFVEGKEDEIFFKHVLSKKYSGKKESILSKIKFIQTDGYRNIDGYAYLKILRADNVTAQFCAIADSDGVESDQRKTNVVDNIKQYVENKMEVSELQKLVYILKGYSIETYLLDSTILNNAFPEISKDNIDELVKVYFEKYEAGIKEVNEGKRELSQFQRYYKPKLIFTRDAQKNPTYYKHYLKNYDDDKNFKETREAISNRCRGVEKSGTSYVEYILSKNDTKIAAFSEPVAIIDSIVDQFFNNK